MTVPGSLYTPTIRKTRASAYLLEQSLLFNDDDSAYLSRIPSSTGDTKTWTFSAWVKFDSGTNYNLLMGHRRDGAGTSTQTQVARSSSGVLMFYNSLSGSQDANLSTEAQFRDTSAWYHIVYIVDTTEATDTNRVKIIVNGTQQTIAAGADWPALNATTRFNEASRFMWVGSMADAANNPYLFFGGSMAEVNFVDGTALAATYFGETDGNGFWNPIEYTGSYGTNGFQLKFADTSAFGNDTSGNNNDYTPNNFATADQLEDSPTDSVADGIGNFPTFDPDRPDTQAAVYSEGNRLITSAGDGSGFMPIGMLSGKWYWEVTVTTFGGNYVYVGIGDSDAALSTNAGAAAGCWQYHSDGYTSSDGVATGSAWGASYGLNSVIGVAYDADNGFLYVAKDNTFQASGDPTSGATGTGALASGLDSAEKFPIVRVQNSSNAASVNMGQTAFTYTPPTGYVALATQNLPPSAPLYTGTAAQYRVGAPIINPFTDLPNAVHGWRADLGLTLTGSSVDQWDDQIGSWNLVDGGTKPTVLSSNINGLDAISFPGDGGNLSISGVTLTMPYTMLMVMKQITWSLYGYPFGVFTQKGLQQRSSTPQLTQGDNLANTNSAATVGSYFPIMAEFGNTTSDFLHIGDTRVGGTASGDSSISNSSFMLGAAQSSPPSNRSANVAYAEFIIVDGAMSEFDLANYRAYVKSRYGV